MRDWLSASEGPGKDRRRRFRSTLINSNLRIEIVKQITVEIDR